MSRFNSGTQYELTCDTLAASKSVNTANSYCVPELVVSPN